MCCNACPLWRRGNRHNYFTKSLWISVANQLEKFQSVFAWNFTAAFVSTTACLVLLINYFPHFTPLVLWLQLIESLRWLFRTFEMLLWGIKHYSQWFWAYIYIHVCVFMFFLISWGLRITYYNHFERRMALNVEILNFHDGKKELMTWRNTAGGLRK